MEIQNRQQEKWIETGLKSGNTSIRIECHILYIYKQNETNRNETKRNETDRN